MQKSVTDRLAVWSMRLTDFSRSSYLFLAAGGNTWSILLIYYAIKWKVTCQVYFRVAAIIFVSMMFFQILFIFSRLVVVYSCLPKYNVLDAFKVLLPFLLVWCILTIVSQVKIESYEKDGICHPEMDIVTGVIMGVFFMIIELVSFWLFYQPLREIVLDGQYSRLKIFATERTKSAKEYFGMRPSTISLMSDHSQEDEGTNWVIRQFATSIERNFYCWMVTLVVSISWFITFYSCMRNHWYNTSGFGEVQISVSLIFTYLSMMACEKHWLRMFIIW